MERMICVCIGYAFGLLQTGYLYGKLHHIDIRKQGSGNAGTTNALRTLGVKAGLVTLLGDAFKCVFAVLAVHLIYKNSHLKAGTNYKLTYKINVSKAMTVKINGQSKELVAGDNSVELNVTGSGTSFIIMFDQQTIDTTVTVSNVLWTEILA